MQGNPKVMPLFGAFIEADPEADGGSLAAEFWALVKRAADKAGLTLTDEDKNDFLVYMGDLAQRDAFPKGFKI